MRLLDVRHEQTAAFAAEATGKLTRVPGLAVLTAGPGVTNGVSAIAQAQFAGSPMVVVGGRAPNNRWGSGSLQELDQPPIVASVSKLATTLTTAGDVLAGMDEAFTAARSSHRGPAFVDVPMDEFFNSASGAAPAPPERRRLEPDPDAVARIAGLLAEAQKPVLVLGTDVWADGAEEAALRFVEALGAPDADQRHGPGHRARRPPAAGHQGPQRRARRRRPGRRGRDAAGLPARLRRLRRQGGRHRAGPRRARRRLPRPGVHARRARGVRRRRPDDGHRRAAGRGRARREAGLVGVATDAAGHREGGRRARRRAARRRGRPDPPGPDLRRAGPSAGRGRGGDRRRWRLRQLRRQVRRAEAARRLARPRPLRLPRRGSRARRSRPGSPGPPPRSCCCSATARPASRSWTSTRWSATASRSSW